MKILVDFENEGPLSRSLAHVLGTVTDKDMTTAREEADVVIVGSVDKVLWYLQQTDKKVVQFCVPPESPMVHLIEDYPRRLRVVDVQKSPRMLVPLLEALGELEKS